MRVDFSRQQQGEAQELEPRGGGAVAESHLTVPGERNSFTKYCKDMNLLLFLLELIINSGGIFMYSYTCARSLSRTLHYSTYLSCPRPPRYGDARGRRARRPPTTNTPKLTAAASVAAEVGFPPLPAAIT